MLKPVAARDRVGAGNARNHSGSKQRQAHHVASIQRRFVDLRGRDHRTGRR